MAARAVKQEDLHAWRQSVARYRHIGVVSVFGVLYFDQHAVAGFGRTVSGNKAGVKEEIMQPVGDIEGLHHRRVLIVAAAADIVGTVEGPVKLAGSALWRSPVTGIKAIAAGNIQIDLGM